MSDKIAPPITMCSSRTRRAEPRAEGPDCSAVRITSVDICYASFPDGAGGRALSRSNAYGTPDRPPPCGNGARKHGIRLAVRFRARKYRRRNQVRPHVRHPKRVTKYDRSVARVERSVTRGGGAADPGLRFAPPGLRFWCERSPLINEASS